MSLQQMSPHFEIRGLHLDLKGTPPTFPRLLQLLDCFSSLRYNLILVEWEDTFPWTVDPTLRSNEAYSEDEIRQFVVKAERLGIELVPLVQILGHMENVLKAPERAALREHPENNDVLNPLAKGASELVRLLIEDVLRLMPNVRRFHLGVDEAYHLGTSAETAAFIRESGMAALYMHHIQPLLDLLNARGIRPLMWHDMLIHWEDAPLRILASQVDLVVWGYGAHPDEPGNHYSSSHIARFKALSFTLWGACAFKGAEGTNVDRPNPYLRLKNGRDWVQIADRYQFKGIITTGWSRYCYNTCQCEMLEASLDIFVAHALLLHDGCCSDESLSRAPQLLEELWSVEEGERFARIRVLADRFAAEQEQAWYQARTHLSHLAAIQIAPHRKFSAHYLEIFGLMLSSTEKAARDYYAALQGLVSDCSLAAYFAERIDALKAVKNMKALLLRNI